MPLTAECDPEADALYVHLSAGLRTRAVEIDESTFVDVDGDGYPVGIEILYPTTGISLGGALDRFSLHQQEPAILAAIARLGAPIPIPTYTGGSRMATSVGMTVTVEGTVGAYRPALQRSVGVTHPDRLIRVPA
jgi:uncharacterized protein YuzE